MGVLEGHQGVTWDHGNVTGVTAGHWERSQRLDWGPGGQRGGQGVWGRGVTGGLCRSHFPSVSPRCPPVPFCVPLCPSVPPHWGHPMASPTMDPLTLTLLAMTAMTAAAAAATVPPGDAATPVVVALDMARDSFDDQYRGCGRAMAAALPALNRSELRHGGHFAEAWALAAAEWRVRLSPGSPRSPLSPPQATALLAYTAPVPLHREFNEAVRAAGRSRREYRDNFHFKTLHFLLTQVWKMPVAWL
ncbi:NAD(P)(+)--arginine ADP-ribosyltransferase 2-like [Pyrgilauda ruficollis]|uniref:NAD(P)(+)--arginine ADP-ribosyltransferase 2-like n=1 Tax=Pyrgilauda ruficollis TaxID=221976 RepID=UPI001B87945E|nr:NAD(P)(+)--arginine ADP-ribosyltransferase 2-like [Pyrgilauda ruficollis]